MELYKREKANPLAGCVPMLIQIPVFFSLYKVLYVTIEMRQAPFYGWIHDLSAPDPTSLLNLFGLIPYDPAAIRLPAYRHLAVIDGLHPVRCRASSIPPPADPVQAKMFTFMPLIFTFMFATFPAGLVIYYTWNNLLTVDPAIDHHEARRRGDSVVRQSHRQASSGRMERRPAGIRARLLFAGPCDFVWGTATSKPAAAEAARSGLCRPLQCRQVQPDQRADRAQTLGPGLADAGPHPQINFFNLGRPADAGGPAGLWLSPRRSKDLAPAWQELIFAYLRGRATLRRVAAV